MRVAMAGAVCLSNGGEHSLVKHTQVLLGLANKGHDRQTGMSTLQIPVLELGQSSLCLHVVDKQCQHLYIPLLVPKRRSELQNELMRCNIMIERSLLAGVEVPRKNCLMDHVVRVGAATRLHCQRTR
jgi:hypothetical protein